MARTEKEWAEVASQLPRNVRYHTEVYGNYPKDQAKEYSMSLERLFRGGDFQEQFAYLGKDAKLTVEKFISAKKWHDLKYYLKMIQPPPLSFEVNPDIAMVERLISERKKTGSYDSARQLQFQLQEMKKESAKEREREVEIARHRVEKLKADSIAVVDAIIRLDKFSVKLQEQLSETEQKCVTEAFEKMLTADVLEDAFPQWGLALDIRNSYRRRLVLGK